MFNYLPKKKVRGDDETEQVWRGVVWVSLNGCHEFGKVPSKRLGSGSFNRLDVISIRLESKI